MTRRLLIALAAGYVLAGTPAAAQLKTFPELEGRIPAPLPPPPEAPVINGFNGRQGPPPGIAETKPLTTHGDRVTRCMHQGAVNGLHGGRLSRYVRRCGNSG